MLQPEAPALARFGDGRGARLGLWDGNGWRDLSPHTLASLLGHPLDQIRTVIDDSAGLPRLDVTRLHLLAPADLQEVWAAGVTYLRSRDARIDESGVKDVYARVYEADRPELFFKAAGWRVVADGGDVGVRPDSSWDVPEPELAVLSNARGEVVAYACGNDMSSRSIEGENPLYLPQAKVYDRSCALGPVAVLSWECETSAAEIRMSIEREGVEVFSGSASTADMVRRPEELVAVLHAAYELPAGAWLLTGTGVVPPASYTARSGDLVQIRIAGLGELRNRVTEVPHSGAVAPPRIGDAAIRAGKRARVSGAAQVPR